MKISKPWVCLTALAIFQAGLIQRSGAAPTNAIIPYKTLDDYCQFADGVDQSKLVVRVFVASKNKEVSATNIMLTIQSDAKGLIPVRIGTNGQVLDFPHQKELRRENPDIVANQPKGTLRLMISGNLAMPDELTFRYNRLGDGVAEANKGIKAQAGILSLLAPKSQGVIFIFPKVSAGKATVKIKAAGGAKEYLADANGQVKLKLEKALLSENPEVEVSEKPQAIMPDLESD